MDRAMERGSHDGEDNAAKSPKSSTPELLSNNGLGLDMNSVYVVREQDRYMPIANVIRIMRKVLPTHAKISDDAKETVQECVSEYISFITSEANDRCRREQRKTITAEDVLWAMSKLGFDEYFEPLTLYLQRYREYEGERTSVRNDPYLRPVFSPFGAGAFGPAFHMAHHQGFYTTATEQPQMGDYFKDGNGVNQAQAQAAMTSFDPYAPYK